MLIVVITQKVLVELSIYCQNYPFGVINSKLKCIFFFYWALVVSFVCCYRWMSVYILFRFYLFFFNHCVSVYFSKTNHHVCLTAARDYFYAMYRPVFYLCLCYVSCKMFPTKGSHPIVFSIHFSKCWAMACLYNQQSSIINLQFW